MPKVAKHTKGGISFYAVAAAILALFVVAVYFYALDIPFLGPDEPRYAQVAREMFLNSDWITPTLGGFPWFEKPVLLYWTEIVAFHLFGVGEFAARSGPALFGLGTAMAVGLVFAKDGVDPDRAGKIGITDLAYTAFIVTATSLGMLVFSRGASFDIIVTFPVSAAMVSFFLWDRSASRAAPGTTPPGQYGLLASFYFFCGVALLAKGLIGIVIPFASVAAYYFLNRRPPGRRVAFSVFWGTPLSLLVASAWYVPMLAAHGWTFFDEFIVRHHFMRFTSNVFRHPQPFWFFWVVFPLMTIPWLPLFLAASVKTGRKILSGFTVGVRKQKLMADDPRPSLEIFAFSWMAVPLVFFSFSGSKLPGYVLPALPAAAILTTCFIKGLVSTHRAVRGLILSFGFVTVSVVAVLLAFYLPGYASRDSAKGLVASADRAGYGESRIAGLYIVTHSVEFYGAGRLFRDNRGDQRVFTSVQDVALQAANEPTRTILLLVPNRLAPDVVRDKMVLAKVLGQNAEVTIIAVRSVETANRRDTEKSQ